MITAVVAFRHFLSVVRGQSLVVFVIQPAVRVTKKRRQGSRAAPFSAPSLMAFDLTNLATFAALAAKRVALLDITWGTLVSAVASATRDMGHAARCRFGPVCMMVGRAAERRAWWLQPTSVRAISVVGVAGCQRWLDLHQ